jgi:DNA-binding GntR family transcriptional regulator
MSKLKRIGKPVVLGEQTYNMLKEAIIGGEFQPGEWLSEDQLTDTLGVSRTPVREAFKQLHSEGLIELFPRKGAHIIDLSENEIDHLFEARVTLETTFFLRAAKNIKKDEIHHFKTLFKEAETKVTEAIDDAQLIGQRWKEYLTVDRSFHNRLVKTCMNPFWYKLYVNTRNKMQLLFYKMEHMPELAKSFSAQHEAILDAMIDNQLNQAKKKLKEHILHVRDIHKNAKL